MVCCSSLPPLMDLELRVLGVVPKKPDDKPKDKNKDSVVWMPRFVGEQPNF